MTENGTISPLPGASPGVRTAGGRNVPNPYLQVALTYLRRPFSSPQGLVVSALFLFICINYFPIRLSGGRHDNAAAPIQMRILFLLAMLLVLMFATHLKNQFADWRASLMPGFRRVHATVAAAVTVLLTIVLPIVLSWLADLHSVGLIALMVFLFGASLWSVTLHWNVWAYFISLGFIAMLYTPGVMNLWPLLSGQFEFEAFALLGLGAAFASIGGIRLVGLNEDMPAYKQPTCVGGAGICTTTHAQAGVWMRPLALPERFMENRMARWTSHARCASTSWWSGVRRWQVATMSAGWSALLMVLFACVFLPTLTSGQNLQNSGAVVAMTMLSFIPSCHTWCSFLRCRSPKLARGLLLPVDRRTFVRQVGTAAAIDQLLFWAGMGAGIALWVWLAGPTESSVTDFAVLLGVSTLFQLWFFGVGAWFARYRNFGMLWGGYFLGFQVLMVAGGLCAGMDPLIPGKYMGLWLAGIIAIFGLLLNYDAYRRWLLTDFD